MVTDIVDPQTRSRMMAGIQGKNTKPELVIRKALYARGFRYRLHGKQLPGKPDLVLKKYNAVIFINGCFWHLHDCHLFKWPSSRPEFWQEKLNGNKERDIRNINELQNNGWRTLLIWECSLKGKTRISFEEIIDSTEQWLYSDEQHLEISGRE